MSVIIETTISTSFKDGNVTKSVAISIAFGGIELSPAQVANIQAILWRTGTNPVAYVNTQVLTYLKTINIVFGIEEAEEIVRVAKLYPKLSGFF